MTTTANQERNWKEKLADLKYRTAIAHDALQIDKDMRRQAVVERLIKKTQDGTLMEKTSEPMDKQLEEEMAVRIGDESHIHYHNESKPSSDQASGIGKTLAAAGLAVAGLGAGIAAPIAAYNLTRPTTAVVQPASPVVDTDTDTKYGLRIYRDEQQ